AQIFREQLGQLCIVVDEQHAGRIVVGPGGGHGADHIGAGTRADPFPRKRKTFLTNVYIPGTALNAARPQTSDRTGALAGVFRKESERDETRTYRSVHRRRQPGAGRPLPGLGAVLVRWAAGASVERPDEAARPLAAWRRAPRARQVGARQARSRRPFPARARPERRAARPDLRDPPRHGTEDARADEGAARDARRV